MLVKGAPDICQSGEHIMLFIFAHKQIDTQFANRVIILDTERNMDEETIHKKTMRKLNHMLKLSWLAILCQHIRGGSGSTEYSSRK